ncbi:MAG: hypothetical protein U9Q69_02405, partial [Nanoarchaeota archaeon]|nr:hypothetical protein [Nanoarchaeota archaeon]
HTLGFGQLNYIMHFFKEFIANAENSDFNQRIKKSMAEFNQGTSAFYVPNLNPLIKARKLSLIAERQNFMQFFNECYSVNYELSLAGLAQAQRHRTLNYQIQPISGDEDVFIPPILLYDTKLSQSWKSDMEQVRKNFPQGLLAKVNERGTYEDFISKANERLCGQVQLEIMLRTKRTLMEYIAATKGVNNEVHDLLLPYNNGPKCTFPNIKCLSPCEFKKKTLERLI